MLNTRERQVFACFGPLIPQLIYLASPDSQNSEVGTGTSLELNTWSNSSWLAPRKRRAHASKRSVLWSSLVTFLFFYLMTSTLLWWLIVMEDNCTWIISFSSQISCFEHFFQRWNNGRNKWINSSKLVLFHLNAPCLLQIYMYFDSTLIAN